MSVRIPPLGLSWSPLGALQWQSRAVFGGPWGCHWALLGRLGTSLQSSLVVLGRSWGPLGPSCSL
eukprot:5830279-Pyramimonas_sp.AAC.1